MAPKRHINFPFSDHSSPFVETTYLNFHVFHGRWIMELIHYLYSLESFWSWNLHQPDESGRVWRDTFNLCTAIVVMLYVSLYKTVFKVVCGYILFIITLKIKYVELLFMTSCFMVDWVHFAIRDITDWAQISSNKLRPHKMTGNRHPLGMATFAKGLVWCIWWGMCPASLPAKDASNRLVPSLPNSSSINHILVPWLSEKCKLSRSSYDKQQQQSLSWNNVIEFVFTLADLVMLTKIITTGSRKQK